MKRIWRTIGWLIFGAALWLPTAQAATGFGDSPSFVVNLLASQVPPPWIGSARYLTNGSFQLEFNGTEGYAYTLLASTGLETWTPVLNFICTNTPMDVVDPGASHLGWRFYRMAQGTWTVPVP